MAIMLALPLSPASLSALDWALVAIVAFSALLAFQRGIIRVLFSLAGLFAGTLIASWNYPRLALVLHRWISSTVAAQALAFLSILVVVAILFSLAGGLVRRTAKAVGLGLIDRLLGAVFGVVRGLFVGVALMMGLAAFLPGSDLTRGSVLSPYLFSAARGVSFLVPQRFRQQVTFGTRRLMEKTPELLRPEVLRH